MAGLAILRAVEHGQLRDELIISEFAVPQG